MKGPTIVQREWLRTATEEGRLSQQWPVNRRAVSAAMIDRVIAAGWAETDGLFLRITDAGRAAAKGPL